MPEFDQFAGPMVCRTTGLKPDATFRQPCEERQQLLDPMRSHSMSGKALLDHFSALDDPRQTWKVVYALPEILLVVLSATMAGAEGFVEVERWGKRNSNGIPQSALPAALPLEKIRYRTLC